MPRQHLFQKKWPQNGNAPYFTSNGGQSWDSLNNPKNSKLGSWSWFYGPAFIDNLKGYMVGYGNSPSGLVKTVDGGRSWSVDSTFAPTTDYLPVFYLDKWNNGWCIGDFGAIYTNKIKNNAGIKKNNLENDLNFPNKIQVNKSYALVPLLKNTNQILIYNSLGKIVSNVVVSSRNYGKETFPVNIDKMSPGLYFLALKSDETIQKTYTLIIR
jgi:hypothetical protein